MTNNYRQVQLKQKYKNEQVLVIPEQKAINIPDNFCYGITKSAKRLFQTAHTFIYRWMAEYNYAFVQLISYIIVTNKEQDKLFVTQRIAGEERLISSYSFSGGHVNPEDFSRDTMRTAAMRELNEELDINLLEGTKLIPYGTVRDFSSTTRDHLGLVFLAVADKVAVKEKNTLRGEWMDIAALVKNYYKFESWGRYVIDHLFVNSKNKNCLFLTGSSGVTLNDRKYKKTVGTNGKVQ